jgi:hypothetical protein
MGTSSQLMEVKLRPGVVPWPKFLRQHMFRRFSNKVFPYLVGTGASLGLIAFYSGIMTLTADLVLWSDSI